MPTWMFGKQQCFVGIHECDSVCDECCIAYALYDTCHGNEWWDRASNLERLPSCFSLSISRLSSPHMNGSKNLKYQVTTTGETTQNLHIKTELSTQPLTHSFLVKAIGVVQIENWVCGTEDW